MTTAIKYIGTPAWKTKNNRAMMIKKERNQAVDPQATLEEGNVTVNATSPQKADEKPKSQPSPVS